MNFSSHLPTIGNCAFFTVGETWHHLYHMLPYIRATQAPVYFIGVNDSYLASIEKNIPWLKFAVASSFEDATRFLSRHDILYCSNFYLTFKDNILPRMNHRPILVRISHGVGNKIAENPTWYRAFLTPFDVTIIYGRRDLDLAHAVGIIPPLPAMAPDPLFIDGNDGRTRMLIQGGNPRLEYYMSHRPTKEEILAKLPSMVPDRPTLLFTPTYPASSPQGGVEPSAITLFMAMMERLDGGNRFNIMVKLHPNLLSYPSLITPLLAKYAPGYTMADGLWTDYLSRMDVADMLICDHTSTVTDFLFFDKPILFLDPSGNCPDLATVTLTSRYWSYQLGNVLSPTTLADCATIMEDTLTRDSYGEKRRRVKEYSYRPNTNLLQVMGQVAAFANHLRSN